jgi:hypothetical protein
MRIYCDLRAIDAPGHSGEINWLLWVDQDDEGHGASRLFAGRVKFQDDPIALANCILYDAFQQTEPFLIRADDPTLF